jgi:hypothetical protein
MLAVPDREEDGEEWPEQRRNGHFSAAPNPHPKDGLAESCIAALAASQALGLADTFRAADECQFVWRR